VVGSHSVSKLRLGKLSLLVLKWLYRQLTRLSAMQWTGVQPLIMSISVRLSCSSWWYSARVCHVMFEIIYYVTTNTDSRRKHHSKSESSCLKAAAYDKMVP
jgi:hypothetical protein